MAIQHYNRMLGFFPPLCGHSFKRSRCKKLLKISISRIELLTNKRVVQVNQQRRDIAQLLQLGHEQSVRTRLARLWKEQNLFSAYDTIGQCCKLVLPNLANIGGQRSCPEDLVEAVSSLIFAASSCADLPELQDLREILATKYGSELPIDSHVNEEILGAFSSHGPSEAAKQNLLMGIAKEYNVSVRFSPRIQAPPEDMPENLGKVLIKRLPGPVEDDHRAPSFPESDRLREESIKFMRTPTCVGDVAEGQDDDSGRTGRITVSIQRIDEAEAANGNLDCSPIWRSLDQRNANACVQQSSYESKKARENDLDVVGCNNWSHQKEAKSVRTRGKISVKKIMDRGDGTLLVCCAANDNGGKTQTEHEDSISVFIPKTKYPEPPQRPPPPPPPARVASSPSLYVESLPKVPYPRSSTLASHCYAEHRDAHVHPKLPEYDDLVARFAALKLKIVNQQGLR